MNVVVRRRAGLMALVAIVSAALAVGYLWRFSETETGSSLVLGVALGLVAVVHAFAWRDARTPLLVADATGLRVRLGSTWTGIPWSKVERVEVDERGRLTDGHVAVLAANDAGVLEGAGLRSRFAAALNRTLYDASLVVPYGVTTTVSVVDVAETLNRLADGRAEVVLLDAGGLDEPRPTIEITTQSEPAVATPSPNTSVDLDEPDTPPEQPTIKPPPKPKARRFGLALRQSEPTKPAGSGAAPLQSQPARREEVTMPIRREPVTMGMLALSEPVQREQKRSEQESSEPESSDRRQDNVTALHPPDEKKPVGDGRGNISLIIDATTDLSAKAMSKVRRHDGQQGSGSAADGAPGTREDAAPESPPLKIGAEIRQARLYIGISVDEVAERTRIRPFVIESIEVDDFAPCGGDFYARGHLRMLARMLGIDSEPLITTYDESFATSPINARAVFDAELSSSGTGLVRGGGKAGTNWGALVAVVLVFLLVWGVVRYFSEGQSPVSSQGPQPTQNPSGLGSPGVGNEPPTEQPLPPEEAHVKVSAVGGDSRVVVMDGDDDVLFEGQIVAGTSEKFVGDSPLQVTAQDGGVITLSVKGRSRGLMGRPSERATASVFADGPSQTPGDFTLPYQTPG
ncbi:MAG: helix-turn-helix domain-containing protein [Nocardioidaceae bacterium]|nr:helix-turn-helix domain-containing protein [Nocardioidaceae bacterium]